MVKPMLLSQWFTPGLTPTQKARDTVGSLCLTQDIDQAQWVMMGIPDDRGVAHNFGRTGAKEGPHAFRERFFHMGVGTTHPTPQSIFDAGDVALNGNVEQTLERVANAITEIKKHDPDKKILVIGGGHDGAYAEIAGCVRASQQAPLHQIINLDAHSDVRGWNPGEEVSSGTPFFRLIEHQGLSGRHYHPFGLQKPSNGQALVDWMKANKVDARWLEDMPTDAQQISNFTQLLTHISQQPWHFSIDLDAFASAYAPGVSAQASIGLTPNLMLTLEDASIDYSTLSSMGVFELAPAYDIDGKTAKLAAQWVYRVMSAQREQVSRKPAC